MKRILIIIFITIFSGLSSAVYSRLFFIGSDPYLAIIGYPQAILHFKKDFAAYTLDYEYLPSWGDVDEYTKKPNNSYASSFESVTFAPNAGDYETSNFKKDGNVNIFQHRVDYLRNWIKNLNTLFTLKYKMLSMETSASGNLRAQDDSGNVTAYVPFKYRSSSDRDLIYLESTIAYKWQTVPIGLKLGYGREKSERPKSDLTASAHGIGINSERLLWGWSTSGCNKIFEYDHINGDAWFQNAYSSGSINQFDIQLGASFKRAKIGARYRTRTGSIDNYRWEPGNVYDDFPTEIAEILDYQFNGRYVKQKWSKEIDENAERIYVNAVFYKTKQYNLNTLFFLGRNEQTKSNVHSDNSSISNDVKQYYKGYIIEANPNVNIFIGKSVVVDAAVLLEYAWSDSNNTYKRWNSSMGGSKTTYWDTNVYVGDEQAWEEFSYAEESFYDYGWELNIIFPLFKTNEQKLSVSAMLFHNNKITDMKKIYGQNENTTGNVVFNETNRRYNRKKEMWLNSTITLFYKRKSLFLRLTYVEPLIYSVDFTTRVEDNNGTILYRKRTIMQTAVQETASVSHPTVLGGPKISFMIGYEF